MANFSSKASKVTLDHAGGTPYFRRTLDLGAGERDYTRGAWVRAQVSEHSLRLTPQRELKRSMGFVAGNNCGPDLILDNLGSAAWKEMLADADDLFGGKSHQLLLLHGRCWCHGHEKTIERCP
jgi:hypothetical protein